MKDLIFMTGLPRSGSGIICNALGSHPQISIMENSPLCEIVNSIREAWADEPLLYEVYKGFYTGLQAFMYGFHGCFEDNDISVVVDRNQKWLENIELVFHLFPSFKMIVTLRDIKEIYLEVEAASKATILCESNNMNTVDKRAINFFSNNHALGSFLSLLGNLKNMGDLTSHMCFVRREDFVNNASVVMEGIIEFLGLKAATFTPPSNLSEILSAPKASVPEEIIVEIQRRYDWFYKEFYGNTMGHIGAQGRQQSPGFQSSSSFEDSPQGQLATQIEREIQAEIASQ